MNYSLQSTTWRILISSHGAELQSLFHKPSQTELLWQGDATFWGRRSPVLFPNVGKLKENTAFWKGNKLELVQHGFARDLEFEVVLLSEKSITFRLIQSEQTKILFPADFQLEIKYSVENESLRVSYELLNSGSEKLIAGLGGHPAFNCPFQVGDSFDDYQLTWEKNEDFFRNELKDGLLTSEFTEFETTEGKLDLSYNLFDRDALVFHDVTSNWIELHPKDRSKVLRFVWNNFQTFGIWTKNGAPFLCLEPWNGHADLENTTGNWEEKPRMIQLNPNERHSSFWEVSFHVG